MPKKAKKGKLKSGRYRHQIAYYDDEGRRRVKSFVADTPDEAMMAALRWKAENNNSERVFRITVYEAVQKYIDIKRHVLSPSTLYGYDKILRVHFGDSSIGQLRIDKLTGTIIQIWVSTLAQSFSPKTVRNIYMLFKAAVEMFMEYKFKITLPGNIKPEYHCPNDDDIRKLLFFIRDKYGEDSDLEIAVCLAAFGTLRRSECCGLTTDDISGDTVKVCRAVVPGEFGEWVTKTTKTRSSTRSVVLPDFVIRMLKTRKGKIISYNPDQITTYFGRCVRECGIEHIRFHDLRHYSASIMHAIGVPDQYIMDRGGWASDHVMKSVYRNVIDIEKARQTAKINNYFVEHFQ